MKQHVRYRRRASAAPAPPAEPEWRSALYLPPARSIDRRRAGQPPWIRTQYLAECIAPLARIGVYPRSKILAARFMPVSRHLAPEGAEWQAHRVMEDVY